MSTQSKRHLNRISIVVTGGLALAIGGIALARAGSSAMQQSGQPIAVEASHNSSVTFGSSATVGNPAGTQAPATASAGFAPFVGN